jgi:hypothetical protein
MPSLVAVGAIDSTPESIRHVAEGKGVARVNLDLEKGLLPVSAERALSHDQAHNVPDIEFLHEGILILCSALEQWHVAHAAKPIDVARGTHSRHKDDPAPLGGGVVNQAPRNSSVARWPNASEEAKRTATSR